MYVDRQNSPYKRPERPKSERRSKDKFLTRLAVRREMETLRLPQRIVDISEPILVEDSTHLRLSLSLVAVMEQMSENATHHDYFVALLLVLLAESGFRIFSSDNSTWEKNSRLVYIPKHWKSPATGVYEIHFVINKLASTHCKLLVIPYGNKMIVNMFSMTRKTVIYSIVEQCLKYVHPYCSSNSQRYMNLKEISRRLKDCVATPLRTDVLLALGLTNPSYIGLPVELKIKIQNMAKLL